MIINIMLTMLWIRKGTEAPFPRNDCGYLTWANCSFSASIHLAQF